MNDLDRILAYGYFVRKVDTHYEAKHPTSGTVCHAPTLAELVVLIEKCERREPKVGA